MADTSPVDETVKPEALENNAKPVATPPVNAPDPAEVERLRKESEQKDLRIRQLENEKAAREKAEADAKAKELEENNQFKDLYEQERTKRVEIERKQEADEKAKAITDARTRALSTYSDQVKAIADDAGITLADDSDEAVTEFRARLDKIQTQLGGGPRVSANNPGSSSTKQPVTPDELREIMQDPARVHFRICSTLPSPTNVVNTTAIEVVPNSSR